MVSLTHKNKKTTVNQFNEKWVLFVLKKGVLKA